MKRKVDYKKVFLLALIALAPMATMYGQDLENQLETWTDNIKPIAKLIIGLAAIGGGIYTYFKVQSDDGGSGKKAIGNYVLALVFGAMLFVIIEFFLG